MPLDSQRVEEIFHQAREIEDPDQRRVLLESACGSDSELRQRVEVLLRADADASQFLQRPAVEHPDATPVDQSEPTLGFEPPAGDSSLAHLTKWNTNEELSFLTPSHRADSLGRLGHYEILNVIGQGGFGIVLRAFDEKLHRVVAVKVLAPELAVHGAARKRFIREARTAAAVKNEHVVAIYDVEENAQPPFLAMEMIDGISLQDKIQQQGPLGLTEILRIGLQMAEGLAAAHKQGLVHRDIKPANILLENGVERVKITDFGLARAVDDASVTQSGTVAGTPMYMSPEQAEGLAIDHRSDLFSLGTVLYAMCTGHPAFRASGTHAVLKRVIEASPRPIRELNPELPSWLCDIIATLHAKLPENRFQTAQEVAELLAARLADVQANRTVEPIQARGNKFTGGKKPANAAGFSSLWPWLAVAMAGALIILATAVANRWVHPIDPDSEASIPSAAQKGKIPLAIAPFEAARAKELQESAARQLELAPEIRNSIGMTLRLIPPGRNAFGTSGLAESAQAFYIGTTEVTVEQFRQFVDDAKYKTVGEIGEHGGMRVQAGKKTDHGKTFVWNAPEFAPSGEHPVTLVTWHDAMAFCDWLSRKEERSYRLPTAAEWRWAERAGSAARFYCGDSLAELDQHAWHAENSHGQTHPVGEKGANAWGLFDLYGNVWELVYDWQRAGRPVDPLAYQTGPAGNDRIQFLGGSFTAPVDGILESSAGPHRIGYSHLGFRVVLAGDLQP